MVPAGRCGQGAGSDHKEIARKAGDEFASCLGVRDRFGNDHDMFAGDIDSGHQMEDHTGDEVAPFAVDDGEQVALAPVGVVFFVVFL